MEGWIIGGNVSFASNKINVMREQIDRKKLKEDINFRIKQGTPKQQIYEDLIPIFRERNTIAELLERTPSLIRRNENKTANIILLILLSITLIFDLISKGITGIIWDAYLVYVVATYKVTQYTWIWFRAGFALFLIIVFLALNFKEIREVGFANNPNGFINLLLIFALVLSTAIISYLLDKKLCPEIKEKKEWYTDSNGIEKLRLVHEFED